MLGQSCPMHFSTIAKWQRRCDRLSALMRRIKLPHLDQFEADGQTFSLPLSTVDPPKDLPARDELEYLAGFFDGDGCVTLNQRSGKISLQIDQRAASAGVLISFRNAFGGGIYRGRPPTGFHEAVLTWAVRGARVKQAAQLLASVPPMKQAQLRIAAACPNGIPQCWNGVAEDLRTLKRKDHIPSISCSWPYFAGFFDAEGCVGIAANFAGLRLSVTQVNDHVLQMLVQFLHENFMTHWRVRHEGQSSVLSCSQRESCDQTLRCLLAHGLRVKKAQAELALNLTEDNHLKTRDAVSSLGGRQSRYKRLDDDGVARAKLILKLQMQLHRTVCSRRQRILAWEISQLQEEHALQKVIHQCRLLRSDIRQRLADGGNVVKDLG